MVERSDQVALARAGRSDQAAEREGARLHWRAASDVSCDKEGREPLVETSSEAANR